MPGAGWSYHRPVADDLFSAAVTERLERRAPLAARLRPRSLDEVEGAHPMRAAGAVEIGPRWRSREVRIVEVDDDAKPQLLKRYLDRWYWEVKGHVGDLTPESTDDEMRAAAPSIPVFELLP